MNKKPPVLYDHAGKIIEKAFPQTGDPSFLHGTLNKSNSSKIERQPYLYHSWVFACVNAIVRNIASLPHVLIEGDDESPERIVKHEILKLLRQPNSYMAGTELWEYIVLNLMLPTIATPGGQCFLVPESGKGVPIPKFSKGHIPIELWPFSDEVMKPRHDPKTKMLNGWKFVVGGIKMLEFELDEVLRMRLVNPYNIEQGLSPYSAARLAVVQDVKSDEYNTRFFENMGLLGGTLTTDQELEPNQARQIKEEFMAEYGGSGNAGKVAVFGLGVKYEQFLKSHLDMQFSEQKLDNRVRIQAVYGVPDEEIAIFSTGMNRSTAIQADKNFWQKTLIPLNRKIMDSLNIRWVENVDRGRYTLISDFSRVEALRDSYTDEIKNAERLVKMNVPPAEAFRVTQIPVAVDAYAWLETAFINQSMIPIEAAGKEEAPDPPKEDEPPAAIFNAVQGDAVLAAAVRADEEERNAISEKWIKQVLNPGEKSMLSQMQKFFAKLKREMLANVDEWLAEQKSVIDAGKTMRQVIVNPKTFVFNSTEALRELEEIEKTEVPKQMKREQAHLSQEYGDGVQWNVTDDKIVKFVKERQVYVEQINTHTFNAARGQIGKVVQEGVENNWTPQELARNLKDNIKAIKTQGSAVRIARTEMGSISNRSRFDAFAQNKIKRHQWSNSRDERVRGTHKDQPEGVGGEIQNFGTPFSNGLLFPQQPGAPAAAVINCRCISIPLI